MTEARKVQTSESVKAASAVEPASQDEPMGGRAIAVVNLGKKKRKDIRKLRKGRGRLMRKVQNTLADLEDEGNFASADARTVVVIVERKRRRDGWSDRGYRGVW